MATATDKIGDFILVAIFGLAIVQVIAFLAAQVFGFELIKLGTGFLILALAGGVIGAFSIIRGTQVGKLNKDNLIFVVIATALLVAVLFFAQDLIPSIFDAQAFAQTFSFLG